MQDQHFRVEEIFSHALAQTSVAGRAAYLSEACGNDAELRQRVEALLATHDAASGGFLDLPHIDQNPTASVPLSEGPGSKIGRYKLLQQIGEGGFGVVFMAEQEHPVRRRVAPKIIKLGMDTRQVVARFEAERQTLAMMEHPNIAKVLDGGATETGRPYFVMELVKGIPITQYCDEHHLTPRDRLALFIPVCHAVQHAHQKGIIHRDLKPSNVLIAEYDETAVPKVIDFGVAKAVGLQLTEKTMFTAFGQVIGTMEYMSPEHAKLNQLDIDTRSDVYSLGVILYELLTGQTPFDRKRLQSAAFDEMLRIIREEEPVSPSTQLSRSQMLPAVAANRHTEPAKLTRLVRGELDWIVMKCLEKDRNRRYETASVFAADVQRYLKNEPVQACPPSAGYRLRKFARRNKGPFAAIVAVTLALVIGMSVSTWQALRAAEARRRAETEAIKSGQVAQLLQDMLKGVGPSVAMGRDTTMLREILNQTAERLNDLKAQPLVEADLRATLGNVYADLGQLEIAESMLRQALELRRKFLGESDPDVARTLNDLAEVLRKQNKFPQAEVLHREALTLRRKLLASEHPDLLTSLDNLAETLSRQLQPAKSAEAEPMLLEALAARRRQFGNESLEVARSLFNLGLFRLRGTRHTDGERLFREGLAIRRKLLGNDHPEVAESLYYVGESLMRQQKPAEAEPLLEEALAIRQKLFGDGHPYVGGSLVRLAASRFRQGNLIGAQALYRQALAMHWQLPVEVNPVLWDAMNGLTNCLMLQHAYPEAERLQLELLAIHRGRMTRKETFATSPVIRVAEVLRAQGKIAEIESLYREELALRRDISGSDHPNVAPSLELLAGVLGEEGRPVEAEALARESLHIRENAGPKDDWRIVNVRSLLGGTLAQQGKYQEAEPLLLAAYADLSTRPSPRVEAVEALKRTIQLYQDWGMPEKVAEWRAKLPAPTPATQP